VGSALPALFVLLALTEAPEAAGNEITETHCFPYPGCDITAPTCPDCALGPASECIPTGQSGDGCSCMAHRVIDGCDYGAICYQRCITPTHDYVFALASTTTLTSTTMTTTPGPTSTATSSTTTSVTSTSTDTTTTVTETSTGTTTTSQDPATMTGTQLRDLARMGEDNLALQLQAGNGTFLTLETSAATIVAQMVDVAQLSNGSLSMQVPNSSASIAVPEAVLQAVGSNVIVSVAAFSQRTLASFEPTELAAPLAAPPVSVRLRSAATLQDADFGSSMPGEVVIEMLSSTPANGHCGYWDEANNKWSSRGLTPVAGANGTFACATSHLSIFAVIFGEFERVITCSNAHIFSDEGLRAIARGHWWTRGPAWILWFILATQLMLLVWASWFDFMTWYRAVWRDDDFLTSNVAFEGREIGCVTWMVEYVARYLPRREEPPVEDGEGERQPKRRGCCGWCRAAMASSSLTITADCAHYQVAHAEKIVPEDLHDIVLNAPGAWEQEQLARSRRPPDQCTQCDTPYAAGERFCPSCGHRRELAMPLEDSWKMPKSTLSTTAHCLADTMRSKVPEAVQRLGSSGFCIRLWGMFFALHPWLQLRQFSITIGASIRCLLLTAKVLGALMLCSLFFDSSGSALSLASPEECARAGFWDNFWRNVAWGLLSTFLSLLPLVLIAFVSNRRFIYKENWDKASKRSYVQCWRTQDMLLVSMTLIYCGACLLFCMAFLASIDEAFEGEWITSAIVVLLREFIFMPLALAAVYAAVATCVTRSEAGTNGRLFQKVENFVGLAATGEAENDLEVAYENGEVEDVSEHDSWADRVSGIPEVHLQGPAEALEALGEDEVPFPPLTDMELDDVSRGDPDSPLKAGMDLPPNMLDEEEKESAPLKAPCNKCGSRLWAAFKSEICPMCGHLLPLVP